MKKYPNIMAPEYIAEKLGVRSQDIILKIETGELAAMEFGKGREKTYKITNESFVEFLKTNSRFITKPKSCRKHRTAKALEIKQSSLSFVEQDSESTNFSKNNALLC